MSTSSMALEHCHSELLARFIGHREQGPQAACESFVCNRTSEPRVCTQAIESKIFGVCVPELCMAVPPLLAIVVGLWQKGHPVVKNVAKNPP